MNCPRAPEATDTFAARHRLPVEAVHDGFRGSAILRLDPALRRPARALDRPARILVLPGIGDIYWVMVKLQAFIEQELGGTAPIVDIWTYDDRPKSMGYVQRVPFVRAGEYYRHPLVQPEFDESYHQDGRAIFDHLLGHDFYIAYNGILRRGRSLEEVLPEYSCDWFFPLKQPEAEVAALERYRTKYPGGYIVGHLSDFGMFNRWIQSWDAAACARLVRMVEQQTGLPVLLTGGHWDASFAGAVAQIASCEQLAGKTSMDEFFALFRGAAGAIGWCGGNTILATTFRIPTLIAWSLYFTDARFYRNACPPDAWGQWYDVAVVEREPPESAVKKFVRLMERNRG